MRPKILQRVPYLTFNVVKAYYENVPVLFPEWWNMSRKHFRIVTKNGYFLKLNRSRNRMNHRKLKQLLGKYAPLHVYFSVLDWLFPERVGKKRKANKAYPIGGNYVFDVDNTNVWTPHKNHVRGRVCRECLINARELTVHICEAIEQNYSDIQIVFSGYHGFHIHVLDFDMRDWIRYSEKNPIKSHEVARFRYSLALACQCHGFNRSHFIVATDPMRIITVPNSLNAKSGLICSLLGKRKDLEKLHMHSLFMKADPHWTMISLNVFLDQSYSHPELNEPCTRSEDDYSPLQAGKR